eukprot:7123666-Heterocapsa_arctica.AAC.1
MNNKFGGRLPIISIFPGTGEVRPHPAGPPRVLGGNLASPRSMQAQASSPAHASPTGGLQAFFSPARPHNAASIALRADGLRTPEPQTGLAQGLGSPLIQDSPESALQDGQSPGTGVLQPPRRAPEPDASTRNSAVESGNTKRTPADTIPRKHGQSPRVRTLPPCRGRCEH